jgi:Tfp pilus assembly protein PilX
MRIGDQPSPFSRDRRRGEAGSAYIAVLVVLVVLTILALALSLITQTELQIGSNERTVNRVFYAADAGAQVGIAQVLVSRDFRAHTYLLTDAGLQLINNKLQFGTQVAVSEFSKAQDSPSRLSDINQSGTYSNRDYRTTTYAFTSTASRYATINAGSTSTPLAQKTIEAMVTIEPIRPTIVDPGNPNAKKPGGAP